MPDLLTILVFAAGEAVTPGRNRALQEAYEREAENPRIWNRHPRHFSTEAGEFESDVDVVVIVGDWPEVEEAYGEVEGCTVVCLKAPEAGEKETEERDEDDEPESSEEGEGEEDEESETEEEEEDEGESEEPEASDEDQEEETEEEEVDTSDASPAAAQLADEHGLDVDEITGTGKDGRVLVADVRGAIEEG